MVGRFYGSSAYVRVVDELRVLEITVKIGTFAVGIFVLKSSRNFEGAGHSLKTHILMQLIFDLTGASDVKPDNTYFIAIMKCMSQFSSVDFIFRHV